MPQWIDVPGNDADFHLVEGVELGALIEAFALAAGVDVSGIIARTNANDTGTASGTSGTFGTVARTNANDTVAASGTSGTFGTIARTNANDTASAIGTSGTSGTISCTNANDSVSANGDAGQPVSQGGAARPKMRYERQALPTIEDELEEIATALLLLL